LPGRCGSTSFILSEPDLTHDRGIGLDGLVPVSVW
jgi:hypothetical protein